MKKPALYARLGQEDALDGESNSIANQRKILLKYAAGNGFPNPIFFIDDGVSGVTFDSPGWNEMIRLAEAGQVQTVIVKDLSRMGRDYQKEGYYTEHFFAERDIRYIAIEAEQRESTVFVQKAQAAADTYEQDKSDFDSFAAIIRKYVGIRELTPTIVNEFVKKIIVHAPDKSSGHRRQKIQIVWNFIGELE